MPVNALSVPRNSKESRSGSVDRQHLHPLLQQWMSDGVTNNCLRSFNSVGSPFLGRWLCGILLFCGLLSLVPFGAVAQSPLSAADAGRIRMLLTDTELWGQDALAFFASSPRWIEAGEHSALIFHDRIVAGRKREAVADGEPSAYVTAAVIPGIERQLRPEFKSLYQPNVARVAAFQMQAQRFLEDDSVRLTIQRPGGNFLKQGVTLRKIQDRYGKPDKTSTEVVQAQGDRRPAVLTIYSYSPGIQFVMSDLSPTPNEIDRVEIDVGIVAAQLF